MRYSLPKGFFYFICTVWAATFWSCEKAVVVPAYVYIEKIGCTSDSVSQGTASSNITDAWVYVDNKMIGVFELPARFPVLAEGEHTIDISPGIKVSGVNETRAPYPFYTIYSQQVTLKGGEVTEVKPTVTYTGFTKFPWIEDFESPGTSISKTPYSDVPLTVTSDPTEVFEGLKSGAAALHKGQSYTSLDFRSDNAYVLPTAGASVFLEMNYKISNTLVVGIVSNTGSASTTYPAVFLKSTADAGGNLQWKKIYINLTSVVSPETSAKNFTIFFHAETTDEVPDPVYFIDNIKLVHG